MSPFLADIVAKVLERRPESKFAQYSTLDIRFLESKMRVDSQIWNIFLAHAGVDPSIMGTGCQKTFCNNIGPERQILRRNRMFALERYSVSRRRPVYSPSTRRVCSIRGLLSVHSRCGLHIRAVTNS
jgi:hypothetical protein